MEKEDRTCINPDCQYVFKPRRQSQRYCCRSCQREYNNKKAREKREQLKPTTNALLRNRSILDRILGVNNEAVVSVDYLKGAEFNFSYISQTKMADDQLIYCVFEYGLQKLPEGKIKVLRYDG